MDASMPPLCKFNTSTAPGSCPETGAVGTAAKAVVLLGLTAILSEKPARVKGGSGELDPEALATASVELSTTVTELPVGL
jgi:hypothetical protein